MVDNVGLGRKAVGGASVTLVGQGVRLGVLLVSTIVLSRLLSPADFGLMALVTSIVALGDLLRDFGLSTAASRAIELSRAQKSNLFWVNTAIGLLVAGIVFAIAPLIASLFGEPPLAQMLRAITIYFAASGVSTQFRAEINRGLRFAQLAIVDTAPVALGLFAAIAVALITPTYWALVVQQIVAGVGMLLLSIFFARWWPGLPSRSGSIREFVRYGVGLLGTQGIAYVTRNIDNISLGYFWGTSVLGIYSRAYQLLMVPLNQISAPLTRVVVPILTRAVSNDARFNSYLKSGQLGGGILIGVVYAFCIGDAGPLVHVVFGDQWMAMVPVFQALAVGGIFRALNQVTFWAYLATGKTTEQFRFYLVSQPLIVVAILAGLPFGAFGVAIGHSVGYGLNWLISMWWCGRQTGMQARALIASAEMGALLLVLPVLALSLIGSIFIPNAVFALLVTAFCAGVWCVLVVTMVPAGRRMFASVRSVIPVRKRSEAS